MAESAGDGSLVLSDDLLNLVAELMMLRSDRSKAEKDEKEVRKKLLEFMDDAGATRGLTEEGVEVVEIATQHRRNVNRARLEALHPEVFEDVVDEVEVRVVNLNSWQ